MARVRRLHRERETVFGCNSMAQLVEKRALPHFLILKDDSVLVAGLHMYSTRIDWCHQHTVGTGNLCQLLCCKDCVIKGSDGTLQHAWRLQHCKRLPPGAGDIRKAR
jgi:hypothetical protein